MKRTKRRRSKEDVSVLSLWRPLKSFVKGETWRVVVICLGEDLLEKHEDLSDGEPDPCAQLRLMCLFPLLRWSLSFVMFFRVALIGKMLYRSLFLSPKSVHIVVQVRKKR